jgi:hypothetical protein
VVWAAAWRADGQVLVTGSEDGSARAWRPPTPVEGEEERVLRWVQVMTGMELDERAAERLLDIRAWEERRQRLTELGGPPLP